tara:strand:+ start:1367 stop:2065 length:699 start_codon:yes stop_codon:yes gene_type:complete
MKVFIIIKEKSERIPNKNFQLIGNLPLWKHLIYELKEWDVYIDTDSPKIIEECKDLNWVTAYPRKQKFIDFENLDKSKLSPALMMIDNFMDTYVHDNNEIIITTHVTSPFLKSTTLKNAIKKLNEGYDSILSVTKHHEFSWLEQIGDMTPINFNPNIIQKTQDLSPVIMSKGAFFIFKKKTFKEVNNRIGNKPYYYPLSNIEGIDIDNYDGLELAKTVYSGQKTLKDYYGKT